MIVGRIAEEAGTMSDNVVLVLVLVLSCPVLTSHYCSYRGKDWWAGGGFQRIHEGSLGPDLELEHT
jgi:hypothetical protein